LPLRRTGLGTFELYWSLGPQRISWDELIRPLPFAPGSFGRQGATEATETFEESL